MSKFKYLSPSCRWGGFVKKFSAQKHDGRCKNLAGMEFELVRGSVGIYAVDLQDLSNSQDSLLGATTIGGPTLQENAPTEVMPTFQDRAVRLWQRLERNRFNHVWILPIPARSSTVADGGGSFWIFGCVVFSSTGVLEIQKRPAPEP